MVVILSIYSMWGSSWVWGPWWRRRYQVAPPPVCRALAVSDPRHVFVLSSFVAFSDPCTFVLIQSRICELELGVEGTCIFTEVPGIFKKVPSLHVGAWFVFCSSTVCASMDNFSDLVPSIRLWIETVITFHGDLWVVITHPSILNFNGIDLCYQMYFCVSTNGCHYRIWINLIITYFRA